jgi:two-component system chemotaxis response regulator CheY
MAAKRILVVDDEEMVRMVMRSVLASAGFQVTEAIDGEDAIRLCRQPGASFDLVLLDQQMPRLSARETLDQLRRHKPAAKVVMLSGGLPGKDVERWLADGALRFLQKPFVNEELIQMVQEALGE